MPAEIIDLKKWKVAHQPVPTLVINHAIACAMAWQRLWFKLFFRWPSK